MQSILAIIPAKKTSVRVPEKNLRDIGGWPLLRYSVEAAYDITSPSHVYVSSEDDTILDEARTLGAQALLRPETLSEPHIKNIEVLRHSLLTIQETAKYPLPEYAVLLQPTHPFRLRHDLKKACNLVNSNLKPDFVISVKPLRGKVGWLQSAGQEFSAISGKKEDNKGGNSRLVINAGTFYFFRINAFLEQQTLIGKNTVSVTLSYPELEIDLDTEEDFVSARALFNAYSSQLDYKPFQPVTPVSTFENSEISFRQ